MNWERLRSAVRAGFAAVGSAVLLLLAVLLAASCVGVLVYSFMEHWALGIVVLAAVCLPTLYDWAHTPESVAAARQKALKQYGEER